MNNLSSYCGLVDARISASEKDLPVRSDRSSKNNPKFKLDTPEVYRYIKNLKQSPNLFYKRTKISSLEINIFDLKMMVKSGLDFFYFEIQ
jgi:hypothetical protein